MIDTIGIYIPDIKAPIKRLSTVKFGRGNFRGNLQNFKVFENGGGLYMTGSIAKFYQGNNAEALDRESLGDAIRKLESESTLSLRNAYVRRLDIGLTLAVEHHPSNYLAEWGYLPRFDKHIHKYFETVTYVQKIKSFSGYDKISEMKKLLIPEKFKNKNTLRLELSLKQKVHLSFGKYLSPWDLITDEVYSRAIHLWKDIYFRIPKGRKVQFNLKDSTAGYLKNLLAIEGIQTLGCDDIYRIINTSVKHNDIDKTTASRMRKLVKDLMTDNSLSPHSELAIEIDEKVINIDI